MNFIYYIKQLWYNYQKGSGEFVEVSHYKNKELYEKFRAQWEKFREDLGKGKFKFNDTNEAMKYPFLKLLNMFIQLKMNREITLEEIKKYYILCRATKINKDEDIDKISYDRFLPKEEYIQNHNRFSPKGVEYLYLACDLNFYVYYTTVEKISIKEIRAKNKDIVGLCKFEINENSIGDNDKIIDLSFVDSKSFQDIINEYSQDVKKRILKYLEKESISDKIFDGVFIRPVSEIYFKILSSELFKPIENCEKKNQYAPFHCMAYYFNELGYVGIKYKSTVWNGETGSNIVLFNKNKAIPIEYKIINNI